MNTPGRFPCVPGANPFVAADAAQLLALLLLPGMSRRRVMELLNVFGSPAAAWDAVRSRALGKLGDRVPAAEWSRAAGAVNPVESLESLNDGGIRFLVGGAAGYPSLLNQISDAPLALFCRGEPPPGRTRLVAVVGARKASSYGLEVADWIASEAAAAGVGIVSGGARGIDSAAHEAALRSGGFSAAVLGCGVDVVYPPSAAALFRELESSGCLLSEYPPGTRPTRDKFPARNRIIAGMTAGVVVVEASRGSGALITADFAVQEGREVMAVPGPVLSDNSVGTNALIKSGAAVVTSPEDVLEALGLDTLFRLEARPPERAEGESVEQGALLEAMRRGVSEAGELACAAGLSAGRALSLLTAMEVSGSVRRGRGGKYQPAAGVVTRREQTSADNNHIS